MKHVAETKVLLLEDDAEDHLLILRQLCSDQQRFKIDWVQSLAEALQHLGRETYDIVITDLAVPDSIGLATVAEIRRCCEHLPIIVLTSLVDDRTERDILAVGAQDYLVKGEFDGRTIARVIRHAVQRQRSVNEVNKLIAELEDNQQLLREQAVLLQRRNASLQQMHTTAQEYVDNVSHDFRTPLTVIKDYVTIIGDGMVGDVNEEQKSMLDKVSVRADDLNNMVDDLLDISKMEAGLLGAWRRNVVLEDVFQRTESLLAHRARVKNVHLDVNCETNLLEVYCDAEKVARVITNLAVNAIKFAGSDGKVELWAKADLANHQAIVGVTDNGPGIGPEKLEQIFQRFKQVDKAVNSPVKGFGLGLSIAQRLCELNLGEINVESKVGQGSTFTFTLPLAEPTEVFRRWLQTSSNDNRSRLKLIEITVSNEAEASDNDDLDSFFNFLLRQEDLLFRVSPHRWLLVLSVSSSDSDNWEERSEEEYHKINRNRPLGPLPKFNSAQIRTWPANLRLETLLEDFETVASERTLAHIAQ